MENSKSNSKEYNQMTNSFEGNRAEIKKALSRAALSVCINLLLASGMEDAHLVVAFHQGRLNVVAILKFGTQLLYSATH